uniref:Secreted protein n=1 Tax=Ixodes scapularis TaxID=6945 RepID=A0A4D5RCV2_IXOSC
MVLDLWFCLLACGGCQWACVRFSWMRQLMAKHDVIVQREFIYIAAVNYCCKLLPRKDMLHECLFFMPAHWWYIDYVFWHQMFMHLAFFRATFFC